jgi:leucyl aminopeptidase
MTDVILDSWSGPVVPVYAIATGDLASTLERLGGLGKALAEATEFKARPGQALFIPDPEVPGPEGGVGRVLFGLGEAAPEAMGFRALPAKLAAGVYRIAEAPATLSQSSIALAFALGSYRFDRYKPHADNRPQLLAPGCAGPVHDQAHACALARDMINTPANDMGPRQIEAIAREIAEQYGAVLTVIEGAGLLEANYPAVHAVGRAATPDRAPRMLEMTWGRADLPLVAIVGKGVVFDTGGLDIKPSSGMRLMKKDMGGAAHALALARMLMAADAPVRLAVLTPVVENAISADAMRPGDVLASRSGLTIEVGNTDAEGRLILADALTRAGELEPALTLDLATLTGAARAALGPQLPPFFTDDEELAADIARHAAAASDPVWRLPLWKGYAEAVDSDIADIKNDPDAWAQAGSVTAALFLQRFAPAGPWAHFDIFAWNPRGRPGWPVGGEAQAIRGLYAMIRERFG